MKRTGIPIYLTGLFFLLIAFIGTVSAAPVAFTFNDLSEQLIAANSSGLNFLDQEFSLTNATGTAWIDFHLRLEADNDLGGPFPFVGFDDYSGPGTATLFDDNGDAQMRNERMEVVGLSIPDGSTFDFTVDIFVLPPEGVAQVRLFGQPSIEDTPPVPEPATMLLIGAGLVGLARFRRKSKK